MYFCGFSKNQSFKSSLRWIVLSEKYYIELLFDELINTGQTIFSNVTIQQPIIRNALGGCFSNKHTSKMFFCATFTKN